MDEDLKKKAEDSGRKPEAAGEGLSRRSFLGAAAGAAAAAGFLGLPSPLRADNGESGYYYLNSFGDVVPVSQDLIDLGIYPPPLPPGVEPGQPQDHGGERRLEAFTGAGRKRLDLVPPVLPKYNVLLIMVDQLRTPRWIPPGTGGFDSLRNLTPTIRALETQSFTFPNFFVAATACTPSRSTLLTGLYTQQTCQFQTQANTTFEPNLNKDFYTIADILNDVGIPSFWVGKWHLSDPQPFGTTPGDNGPLEYGFYSSPAGLNYPSDNKYPSPNGGGNLGSEGYNPAAGPYNHATHGSRPPGSVAFTSNFYNDAAIADFFINNTGPYIASNFPSQQWFAAVSFVNPHDMTQFPWAYNLNTGHFGDPTQPPVHSYQAPLTNGSSGLGGGVATQNYGDTYLPSLVNVYALNSTGTPTTWNYTDRPTVYNNANGKPDLQTAYQTYIENTYGSVDGTAVGWQTFLNYYFWMQSCVDFQIKRVLTESPPALLTNTAIVFLSDHGEYGGSHNLHAKGGAIYDEALNVPLYVSYPTTRNSNILVDGGGPWTVPYVCSMVDILPFVYGLTQGNDVNWRQTPSSNIYYLRGRESIMDAIYGYQNGTSNIWAQQRRVSSIPNNSGVSVYNNQAYQPYVLTTMDEFHDAYVNFSGVNTAVPTHVTGFRTVDLTLRYANADGVNVYGGGKLGVYSFWPPVPNPPNAANVNPSLTRPDPTKSINQQYEFYDYSGPNYNYPENGNEWLSNPLNATFLAAFNNATVQNELNPVNAYTLGPYNAAYQEALLAWATAVTNANYPADHNDLTLDDDEDLAF